MWLTPSHIDGPVDRVAYFVDTYANFNKLALGGTASIELLEKLCNIKVEDLNAGCCGLAGTFGMQIEHISGKSAIHPSRL